MITFTVPTQKRVWLFVCITALCFIIGSVIIGVLTLKGATPPRLRIAMVLQDVMMWMVPAIGTAVLITRRPAEFLMVRRNVDVLTALTVCLTLVASMPVMNGIIKWNAGLELPESMHSIAQWMRNADDSANEMVKALIGGNSIGSLIIGVLIVGVLAGLSEEFYFRGTMQRLFVTSNVNRHIAVWTTALIFSAIHFQFFGFVPRLLLGAYFGYVVLWSRNIWIGVIAHSFNNTLAVVAMWLTPDRMTVDLNTIGTDFSSSEKYLSASSLLLTCVLIWIVFRLCKARAAVTATED